MEHVEAQQAPHFAHGTVAVVGIFMLIFLLGAGNGLINAQLQQSTRFLANSMRVFQAETLQGLQGTEGCPCRQGHPSAQTYGASPL